MSQMNLDQNVKVVHSIDSDDHATGTVNGSSADTKSFDEAMIVVTVGTITATGTLDVTL